jgi:hypothetical protein
MRQLYKTAGLLFLVASSVGQVNGQTHYGVGAGTQGWEHAFFGTNAGKINTGSSNTFIGQNSGQSNSTGEFNTFTGNSSGWANTKGQFNTFNGYQSGGSNTTGALNTFMGTRSGYHNLTGNFNTFVGEESGFYNSSGTENSFFGNFAGFRNETGQSNTFIGSQSGFQNTFGIANAFLGNNAGYNNAGSNNAFFGYGAGYDNTSGDKNTYLGYASGGIGGLINATAIGANAKVIADNSLVLGNGTNVGIGISAPTYQLHLSTSSAAKLGSSSWTIWSDSRLKKDIADFTDGLDLLKQIKPVKFRYNGEAGIKSDKQFVGIIAQDMQKIAPYTIGSSVYQDSLGNKTEYLDYDANAVTYILINSVKEQEKIIEEKEAKIQEISGQVTELSKRLEQLERIVASAPLKPVGNPAARSGSEPNENGVVLEQNTPNGFSESTSINFFIPQTIKNAIINIYSTDGKKVGSYPVTNRGQSALKLSAKTFRSGVFIYDLVTDGKSNGARKMVVTE